MPVTAYDMKVDRLAKAFNTSLHYTKESLFNSMHTTFIVPKGSPLQVSQTTVQLNM